MTEDPLDVAQQQSDISFERMARLRRAFRSGGVAAFLEEMRNEHREREDGSSGRTPEGTVENQSG